MSRTIRSRYLKKNSSAAYYSKFRACSSRSKFIERQISKWWKPTHRVRRRRTQEEFEAAWTEAWANYEKELAENPNGIKYYSWLDKTLMYRPVYKPHPYGFRWKWVEIDWPLEEAIEEFGEEYDSQTRDGYINDSTRNTGYKTDAKKALRRANKRFCKKVLADEDWENEALPNRKIGKSHKWDWW